MGGGFTARFFRCASLIGGLGCERFGSSLLGPLPMGIAGNVPGGAIGGSDCIVSSRTVSKDHSSQSCSAIVGEWLGGSIGRLTKNRRSTDLGRSVGARAMIFRSLLSGFVCLLVQCTVVKKRKFQIDPSKTIGLSYDFSF